MIPDYSQLLLRAPQWARVQTPRTLHMPEMCVLGAFVRVSSKGEHDPLRAMCTVDLLPETDGHWLHLSISRRTRTPLWGELVRARDELLGRERVCVQLVPPASAWLNVHQHTLHLFSRVDDAGETVPRALWDQVGATGERYEHSREAR